VRLAGLALSAAVALAFAGPWLRDMGRTGLTRQNYRGRSIAFPAGAVLLACSLVALAPLALLDDRVDLDLLDPELRRWAVYVFGVALLGLLDDGLGRGALAGAPRGWRGHAGAVLAGRFSTGAIKGIGALALAAYAVSGRGRESFDYLADLALLLLTTNLFNLLDLRPGRVEKVFAVLLAGLCLGAWTVAPLELLGIFIGSVLVGGWFTLRERAMLGDTGSNLVGALAGISLLVVLSEDARLIALVIVATLNLYGELRSISRTIERVPLLRSLDSLGRLTEAQKADPGR
jgi:UDP-GlcNAc:undecaprenyl-phosphate/decaprenyl-phosphate GlcNAc-1-phosphate transferase